MHLARRSAVLLLLFACAAALSACSRPVTPPRVFQLGRIHNDPGGVFLNEKLVFHFSTELDPASVHSASVRITDSRGVRVRGDLELGERRVAFVPEPVRAPDYSDGGFRPASEYRVELVGFPSPAALRSTEGAPLAGTVHWSFRTVDTDDPETGYIFEDATPESALLARFVSQRIEPGQPLELEVGEPVDPATVFAEDFELALAPSPDEAARGQDGRRIPLAVKLVDNRLPSHDGSGAKTLIELMPLERLKPGNYHMIVPHFGYEGGRPGLRLRDFGGNRVWIQNLTPNPSWPVTVTDQKAGPAITSLREEFLDKSLRSTQEILGVDGTAYWGDGGRVELRYPGAAGDGSDGVVELSGTIESNDVSAVRLGVPAGGRATIASGLETVVLRSQGRMVIEGRLDRSFPGEERGQPLELASLVGEVSGLEGSGVPLTAWLEAARQVERGWTVLVAGGDLIVSRGAKLYIDGGLLLVCGGRIRFSGEINDYRRPLDVYRLGEGGGSRVNLEPARGLVIDPPATNQLKEPLTFAVLSGRIPQRGRVATWHESRIGGRSGEGSLGVRFLDAQLGADLSIDADELHDRPWDLRDAPSLRFLVQLGLAPGRGEAWDPPTLDFVEVVWEPETP